MEKTEKTRKKYKICAILLNPLKKNHAYYEFSNSLHMSGTFKSSLLFPGIQSTLKNTIIKQI
jgi:hypothetical protein